MTSTTTITVELNDDLALALAQFCKRVCWTEMRICAVDDDEAYKIRAAIDALRDALAQQGWRPR